MKPEECIGLEDSRNGILSVHAAGMTGLLVPDLIQPDAQMIKAADAVLPDLGAVIGWLENYN